MKARNACRIRSGALDQSTVLRSSCFSRNAAAGCPSHATSSAPSGGALSAGTPDGRRTIHRPPWPSMRKPGHRSPAGRTVNEMPVCPSLKLVTRACIVSIQSRKEAARRDRSAATWHARSTCVANAGERGSTIPGCTSRMSRQNASTSPVASVAHADAALSGAEAAVAPASRMATSSRPMIMPRISQRLRADSQRVLEK